MSLNEINELIKATPSAKNYNLMTDILELQVSSLVKYIKKDDLTKIYPGGRVTGITEKPDGDYNISLESNNHFKWSVLLSNVFILYKSKTTTEIRQEQFELWKADAKKNRPDEYKIWKEEKKKKDELRQKDPELYKNFMFI